MFQIRFVANDKCRQAPGFDLLHDIYEHKVST